MSDGSPRLPLLLAALFGLALALRCAHLAVVLASPVGDVLVLDARYYHEEALRLVGRIPGRPAGAGFMNFGYPYLLAAIYAVAGASARAALAVQAALGAATAVVLALAAKRLTGSVPVALVSGVLYAAYGPAIFYDGLLLTPCAVNACLALALLLAAGFPASGGLPSLAAAGVSLGAAAVLRANALLLVAPWLVAVWVAGGEHRRRAVVTLAVAAAALPAAIVLGNGLARAQWSPLSANAGMNFWTGNRAGANGIYEAAPFVRNQDAGGEVEGFLEEARRRSGRPDLTLAGADAFWLRQGGSEILEAPGAWLRLELRKLAVFWSRAEVRTNFGMQFVSRISPVLRFTPIGFAVVALLGAGGVLRIVRSRDRRAAWLLAGLVVIPLLTCLLFFVSGEYRHPASLALCVGVAVMVEAAWRSRGRIGLDLVPALVLAPLVIWPHAGIRTANDPGVDVWNVVRRLTGPAPSGAGPDESDLRRAAALADRPPAGVRLDLYVLDARLRAHALLAVARHDRLEATAAIAAGREILSRDLRPGTGGYPEPFAAHLRASLRDNLGELARCDLAKRDPALRKELALAGASGWREIDDLFARNDLAGAKAFVRDALAGAPHEPRLQAAMGALLLAERNDGEGLRWLERSCAGWPEIPDCAYSMASYWLSRGDAGRARTAALEALRRDPAYAPARELLARIP